MRTIMVKMGLNDDELIYSSPSAFLNMYLSIRINQRSHRWFIVFSIVIHSSLSFLVSSALALLLFITPVNDSFIPPSPSPSDPQISLSMLLNLLPSRLRNACLAGQKQQGRQLCLEPLHRHRAPALKHILRGDAIKARIEFPPLAFRAEDKGADSADVGASVGQ